MTIQPNSWYADYYTVYARKAREHDRGLWALPLYESSAGSTSWARLLAVGYVSSRRSNKFHRPSWQLAGKISTPNLVVCKTRVAAVAAGYITCTVCDP